LVSEDPANKAPLAQRSFHDWLKRVELPEASIVDNVLKIIRLDEQEPEELEQLTRQACAMLPRIKITDLSVEVDKWARFTAHFTHLHNGEFVSDRALLLSAILADSSSFSVPGIR
jgi:hypothetical protein